VNNNLIVRISNGLGNQLFIYASAFGLAKNMGRNLLIDNQTSFEATQNISEYNLNSFNLTSSIAPENLMFKGLKGYLKRKFLKKSDRFKKFKSFFIEKKDKKKITFYDNSFINNNYSKNLFLEGHFESEKYFKQYENEIFKEFEFKNSFFDKNNKYLDDIKNSNSVSICIRQNRFNEEKKSKNIKKNIDKSWKFTLEQIKYTKIAIKNIKKKVDNPKFFLWSDDFNNLNSFFNEDEFTRIINPINEKNLMDFYLMTFAKHYIVAPTSYHWWGAYLSKNRKNSIIMRPSDEFFNDFYLNNKDFWPSSWEKISIS
jgi:hypothetical protein